MTALVERFGAHEAIIAWHLDNEPGNHDSARCWCTACEADHASLAISGLALPE